MPEEDAKSTIQDISKELHKVRDTLTSVFGSLDGQLSNRNQEKMQKVQELLAQIEEQTAQVKKAERQHRKDLKELEDLRLKEQVYADSLQGKIRRDYKAKLFEYIFVHKDIALALFNALNNTSLTDPDDLIITKIDDVLYMGRYNDLSYTVLTPLVVYMALNEHQSTPNPNMTIRFIDYFDRVLEDYIQDKDFNIYGSQLIPIPVPHFVTFYNGSEDQPDEQWLYLSDAMKKDIELRYTQRLQEKNEEKTPEEIQAKVEEIYKDADPHIQLKVRMINVREGHSEQFLTACKPMAEYSWLINQIEEGIKPHMVTVQDDQGNKVQTKISLGLREAFENALKEMPTDFIIYPLMVKLKSEVTDMFIDTATPEERVERIVEYRIEQNNLKHLLNVIAELHCSDNRALEIFGIPKDEWPEYLYNLRHYPGRYTFKTPDTDATATAGV